MLFSRPQIFFQLGLDFLAGLLRRNFCAAGGVLFSYSGAIFERLKVSFH
jgi:hypothetical protein